MGSVDPRIGRITHAMALQIVDDLARIPLRFRAFAVEIRRWVILSWRPV